MSITDELREYAKGLFNTRETALAIADRIDAEHEMATSEFWAKINAVPATDENMAEHGWIRMPMGADWEPIRIGDAMVLQHDVKEKPYVVQDLTWDGEDWYFTSDEGFFNACGWEHYRAPTVEDVLREFARECLTYATCVDDHEVQDAIEMYAAKLRLTDDWKEQ